MHFAHTSPTQFKRSDKFQVIINWRTRKTETARRAYVAMMEQSDLDSPSKKSILPRWFSFSRSTTDTRQDAQELQEVVSLVDEKPPPISPILVSPHGDLARGFVWLSGNLFWRKVFLVVGLDVLRVWYGPAGNKQEELPPEYALPELGHVDLPPEVPEVGSGPKKEGNADGEWKEFPLYSVEASRDLRRPAIFTVTLADNTRLVFSTESILGKRKSDEEGELAQKWVEFIRYRCKPPQRRVENDARVEQFVVKSDMLDDGKDVQLPIVEPFPTTVSIHSEDWWSVVRQGLGMMQTVAYFTPYKSWAWMINRVIVASKLFSDGISILVKPETFASLNMLYGAVKALKTSEMGYTDFFLGTYYLMQKERIDRDCLVSKPLLAMAPPHRLEMTEKDRKEMIFFMRLASAAYLDLAEARQEVQYVLGSLGLTLLVSSPVSQPCKPAYHLAATRSPKKTAVLIIRGSKTQEDWMTNINIGTGECHAQGSNGESFVCHQGMLSGAKYLLEEEGVAEWLVRLRSVGYRIVVCGHSLGAGVAAILSVLLTSNLYSHLNVLDSVDTFAYAIPSCMSMALCEQINSETAARRAGAKQGIMLTSVVLRDDIVPRIGQKPLEDFVERLESEAAVWRPLMYRSKTDAASIVQKELARMNQVGGHGSWRIAAQRISEQFEAAVWWKIIDHLRGPKDGLASSLQAGTRTENDDQEAHAQQQEGAIYSNRVVKGDTDSKKNDDQELPTDPACMTVPPPAPPSSLSPTSSVADIRPQKTATMAETKKEIPFAEATDLVKPREVLYPPGRLLLIDEVQGSLQGRWVIDAADRQAICVIRATNYSVRDHLCANVVAALMEVHLSTPLQHWPAMMAPSVMTNNNQTEERVREETREHQSDSYKGNDNSANLLSCTLSKVPESVLKGNLWLLRRCNGCGNFVSSHVSKDRRPIPDRRVMRDVRVCDACQICRL